jgi:hypothetical protein
MASAANALAMTAPGAKDPSAKSPLAIDLSVRIGQLVRSTIVLPVLTAPLVIASLVMTVIVQHAANVPLVTSPVAQSLSAASPPVEDPLAASLASASHAVNAPKAAAARRALAVRAAAEVRAAKVQVVSRRAAAVVVPVASHRAVDRPAQEAAREGTARNADRWR